MTECHALWPHPSQNRIRRVEEERVADREGIGRHSRSLPNAINPAPTKPATFQTADLSAEILSDESAVGR